jgi:hypothetical protein
MAPRNLRRSKPWADAELAVGTLEHPDPLDLEDVDVSPTALGLDEAGNPRLARILAACALRGGACAECARPLCEDCISRARELASPAG